MHKNSAALWYICPTAYLNSSCRGHNETVFKISCHKYWISKDIVWIQYKDCQPSLPSSPLAWAAIHRVTKIVGSNSHKGPEAALGEIVPLFLFCEQAENGC